MIGLKRRPQASFCSKLAVNLAIVCSAWLAFGSSSLRAAINVSVDVDVNDLKAVMPDVGMALHTSVYANQFANAALPGEINQSGIDMLRYPGGNYSDIYHWSNHTASGGYAATTSNFPQFIRLMDQSTSQGMVSVDYGASHQFTMGGQPKEAAAWVAYANADPNIFGTPNDITIGVDAEGNNWRTAGYWAKIRASTQAEYQAWATPLGAYSATYNFLAMNHDASANIKYWEIGNELNGNGYYSDIASGWNWQTDLHSSATGTARGNDPALSPTAYGQNFNQFATAMKAIDPTIKIGAVLTGPGGAGDVADPARNWDRNVILQAGNTMDFAIVHYYTPSNYNTQQVLNDPHTTVAGFFSDVRNNIQTLVGRDPNEVEIHMTEYGHLGSVTGATTDGLFASNAMAFALESGATSVHWLEMSASSFLGDAGTLVEGPAYKGLQILNHLAEPGSDLVDTDTTSSNVDAHAYVLPDGRVGVLLVNLVANSMGSSANDANVTIHINGSTLPISGTKWLYGATQTTPLQTSLVSGLSNNFTMAVPARSIVALLIDAPNLAGDFNDDGTVNAADIDVLWHIVRGTGTDPNSNDSGDLNGDGVVNEDDVDNLLATKLTAGTNRAYGDADLVGGVGPDDFTAWRVGGTGWAAGDFDGSGDVGPDDFTLWRTAPTQYPLDVGPRPGISAVPEPGTLALLLLGVPALLLRRRKL